MPSPLAGPAFASAVLASAALAFAPAARASITAFRFSDLDLRDPHTFVSYLGCRDLTDSPLLGFSFNGDIQQQIQGDGDGDGVLDTSYLLLFDALDSAGSGGTLRFGVAACDTPASGTSCTAGGSPLVIVAYQNGANPCLAPIAGTTRPYTPAITSSTAPCFVTDTTTLTLDLAGIPLSLKSASIAATYVGPSPTTLANGLIRGFLTEADANNTIVPSSYPLFGGQPLSSLLPGGDPPGPGNASCASHSDKDLNGGVLGWWFYLNFTAARVPWNETVAVGEPAPELLVASAYPNPFRPLLNLRYSLARAVEVEITIHDLQGRTVAQLERGTRAAGSHTVTWRARDAEPGVYFVRFSANGRATTRRVALLK